MRDARLDNPLSPIANAVLIRAVSEQLTKYIVPDLASPEAVERAKFAVLALERVAGRLDALVGYSAIDIARYRASLQALISAARSRGLTDAVAHADCELRALNAGTDSSTLVLKLKAIGVALINGLSSPGTAWFHDADPSLESRALVNEVIVQERLLQTGYESALADRAAAKTAGLRKHAPSIHELVTAEAATAYFRERLPDSAGLRVDGVRILPGGRSKYTVFLSISGTDALPGEVVMRQDTGATMIPTTVADEYPLLKSLAGRDLRTAEPLYLEPEANPLGGPFMLVSKLPGKAPGDYFTFPGGSRELVEELARTLGRLHSLPVNDIEVPQQKGRSHIEYTLEQIAYFRRQWQRNALEPSTIIEYAFAWLENECRRGIGGPALVHGDIAPHNYLTKDGHLTGIVDWEFAHIGDPAEDLAYRREFFEQFMSWQDFLAIYYGAGAAPVDERRLKMFAVWGFIRNASFGALGHREYQEGSSLDFANAALSTYLYSYFSDVVGRALERPI
jgi:aminoglycoside phosphotransferase (APT) family kinase protein